MTVNNNNESEVKELKKTSFAQKLGGGAVAGVIGVSCIFPLDMVKTRLQNQGPEKVYKNGIDCFRKIVAKEGVAGLYKGLIPNLVGVTPEKAIKLAVNDAVREYFTKPDGSIELKHAILAGASAGFCQVIATNPMEIVKIQLQVAGANAKPGQKPLSGVDVVRQLGLKGLYKGTSVTLLRDVPFSVLYFPLYGVIREKLTSENGTISFPKVLLSAVTAGTVASAASTPADVVKTRFQVTPKPGDPVYTSIPNCAQQILAKEGPTAFFKGVVPRVLIISPLFGIALTVYEIQARFL